MTDKPDPQKPIVIDARNWTGDEDEQALPRRNPKSAHEWQAYNSDRAKWIFVPIIFVGTVVLAFTAITMMLRPFF